MITPSQFHEHSAYELLQEASQGRIGFDQRLLHVLLDDFDKNVQDIVRYGVEENEDAAIVLDDQLLDIFHAHPTPAAIPFFIEYIRRDPANIPDDFVEALYPIRQHALEPLIELYHSLPEDDAGEVAFLLASFRIYDPRVLEILLDRLEYDAGDGALCLGLYGDPAARPALEKMLGELTSDDMHLRQDISDAIQQLGRPVNEEAFKPFDIWAEYPAKSGPTMDALSEEERVSLIESPDAEYREAAVASWINRDLTPSMVKTLMERASVDPDSHVRGKCWQALGSHIDDETVRSALLEKLEDETATLEERAGALLGLARDAGKDPVRKYAIEFYDKPETRLAALEAMRNSFDRSFASYFPKHLKDSNLEIRREAIYGIGYLGVTDHSESLREYFDDDELRSDALFAYALSMRAEISRGRIKALYRRVEDLAGGLDEEEVEIVKLALDERLLLHGHKPVFFTEAEEESPATESAAPSVVRAGRNDPCPCGSGKKYKKCCGA